MNYLHFDDHLQMISISAAVANLAENKTIFNRVVPQGQEFNNDYAGIFRFRFWRFGEWVEIVVDDRLPTRNGQLIYLRSTEKNEFWGALLEKAYAKLHGSYKALEGGLTIEAAVDFTGGIPEVIDLETTEYSRERLFYIMAKADSRSAFMGCALTVSENFRQCGKFHDFSITQILHEINFGDSKSAKSVILTHFEALNFNFWRISAFKGCKNA